MEIGRNSIIVRNVDFESAAYKKLHARFSLYDKVCHKYVFSAFTRVNDDLYFPGSIGKDVIKNYFPKEEEKLIYNLTAKGSKVTFNIKNAPRDELQERAIKFLLKMRGDNDCRERMLSLRTGSGKTYVTINVLSKLGKKPMIVVDTLDLAAQWKEQFLKHTDLKDDEIVIFSGKDSVAKELKADVKAKVYIAIHRTLNNLIDTSTKAINSLMCKLGIGVRVFDECHVEYKNICQINALSNVEYTIFLTATPGRSSFNDDSLYGRVFRPIPYFDGRNLSAEKYHTVILAKINSSPPLDVKASIKTKHGFSSSRWASYLSNESYDILYEFIHKFLTKFKLVGNKKTFIMLPTLELIAKMKTDLQDEFGVEVGTFIGEIKPSKREDELKKMLVLTNDKIFNKAIDVPDLEVLINCVPVGSPLKTEQILGRLRYKEGKSSILVDVTDYGFEETIRQLRIRKRFYKKEAKKIIELE